MGELKGERESKMAELFKKLVYEKRAIDELIQDLYLIK